MDVLSEKFICLVGLCLIGLACGAKDTTFRIIPQNRQWFKVGSDAVLVCKWEHSQPDVRPQSVSWKANSAGIRRSIRDDPNSSYVFDSSLIDEDRLMEELDWEGTESEDGLITQTSKLNITNFQVTDPENYTCEVDVGRAQKSETLRIIPYKYPTVSIHDVTTEVDIREAVKQPQVLNATMLPSNDTSDNDKNEEDGETLPDDGDDSDMYDYSDESNTRRRRAIEEMKKIEIECLIEDAYPKPSRISFQVGETEEFEPTTVDWMQNSTTKLFTGVAKLELEADPLYDGKAVSCSSFLDIETNEAETKSGNTSSTIKISHDMTYVQTVISPAVANAGDDVQILCESDGNPRPTFSVTGLQGTPDFETSDDGRRFTIRSVSRIDDDSYTCVGTVEDDRMDPPEFKTLESVNSPHLQVQYIEDPTLDEREEEIILMKGGSKAITCMTESSPNAEVEWKKDGKVISNKELRIENAEYEDQGDYVCVVSNVVGTKSKKINIKVAGKCEADFKKPEVLSSQEDAGKYYVKLECLVTGQPECTVDIVSQDNFKQKGEKSMNGQILEYKSLPELASPVSFYCIARNTHTSPAVNVTQTIGVESIACCAQPQKAGLSTGAIIGIILLVLVIVIGIPLACFFVKKRNAQTNKKTPTDVETAAPEKESLNKEASSEDSDTGSLPPPPADTDHDHRLNSAHEMTTFSTNQ